METRAFEMQRVFTAFPRLVAVGFASLLMISCGGQNQQSSSSGGNNQQSSLTTSNPVPKITAVSPSTALAGSASLTLTINGNNFIPGPVVNGTNVSGSTVNFGGIALTTTVISATQITAAIPAAALAAAGTVSVTVTNSAPGGGTSNTLNFSVTTGTNPVPTINSLDPIGAPAGAGAFNLWVYGSNFSSTSVVRWNGSDRPTTVVDTGTAEAQIPASDIAAPGAPQITVFNPAPGGGSSNPSLFNVVAGGAFPQSIAADPTGRFVYTANFGFADFFTSNVSMFRIDSHNGTLTSIGAPAPAEHGPYAVAVHPSGQFAYVVSSGDQGGGEDVGAVSTYSIDSVTGGLTSVGTISGICPGLCAPQSIAIHPSGKFAYVTSEGGFAPTTISMYRIDPTTGSLGPMGVVAAGSRALSITLDPNGKFAYVFERDLATSTSDVSIYTVDSVSGLLTSVGVMTGASGSSSVTFHPTSKFAYLINSGNILSICSVSPNSGELTSIGVAETGTGPAAVAVHPSGNFAYVVNAGSNNISMYSVDIATGTLTSTGTIDAGVSPGSIAIDSTGKFAYVADSGSNNVSAYSIDPVTGALTLIGTVGT